MAASIPRAGLLVLAAVGLAQVLVTLDYFSLTVAIPQMADDLDVSTTDIQWALTGYLLSFAALMVAGGRIGDIVGRKRTLLIGVAIFGGASLLCGLAYDEYMLVACRVLQGVGAAILFPTSMGIVGNSFDDETRPRAIGAVVLVFTVGTALGPLVGGVLTDVLDWRWVFLVNVPFSVLAGIMISLFVEESRDESVTRHVNYRGVVTLSGAIVAVTLAIDRGPSWAESDPVLLAACLAAFVVLIVAFVLFERRVESPLVDLPTFKSHAFVMVTLSGFLSNFLWALSVFVATLWLQDVKDLSPLESGLAFLAMSAGVAFAGPLSGRLVTRYDVGALMAGSSVLGAAGAFGVSLVERPRRLAAAVRAAGPRRRHQLRAGEPGRAGVGARREGRRGVGHRPHGDRDRGRACHGDLRHPARGAVRRPRRPVVRRRGDARRRRRGPGGRRAGGAAVDAPPPGPGGRARGGVAIRPRCYGWITDSGGRGAVIGSACLWTTLHAPSSRRKTVVTLTATRTFSSAPPTRAR